MLGTLPQAQAARTGSGLSRHVGGALAEASRATPGADALNDFWIGGPGKASLLCPARRVAGGLRSSDEGAKDEGAKRCSLAIQPSHRIWALGERGVIAIASTADREARGPRCFRCVQDVPTPAWARSSGGQSLRRGVSGL